MFTVVDEVDGAYYIEMVITQTELRHLEQKEILESLINLRGRKHYFSVRIQSEWDDEEETI